jgi:hypothetical protein
VSGDFTCITRPALAEARHELPRPPIKPDLRPMTRRCDAVARYTWHPPPFAP